MVYFGSILGNAQGLVLVLYSEITLGVLKELYMIMGLEHGSAAYKTL